MRIIVTRPDEDAAPLAEKLSLRGHTTYLLPLVQIVPRHSVVIPNTRYQLICLTSANGVRSLRSVDGQQETPLIAVGAQSLQAATKAGFKNAIAEGGDVHGLVAYVQAHYKPLDGPILYLSGSTVSGDLAGQLNSAGFQVERLVCYDAVPAKLDSHEAEIKNADAVMLYSPRVAKIWCEETMALGLQTVVETKKHFCLSANVAAALPQSWVKRIAIKPTENAMLDLLD